MARDGLLIQSKSNLTATGPGALQNQFQENGLEYQLRSPQVPPHTHTKGGERVRENK